MKSKFADFVRIIYGDNSYKDHEYIKNKDEIKIKGMNDDMYIITHNIYENEIEGIKSKFNIYEAKYLCKLCEYLLKEGYANEPKVILTFYLEQGKELKNF